MLSKKDLTMLSTCLVSLSLLAYAPPYVLVTICAMIGVAMFVDGMEAFEQSDPLGAAESLEEVGLRNRLRLVDTL